jgi:hypothetical protein
MRVGQGVLTVTGGIDSQCRSLAKCVELSGREREYIERSSRSDYSSVDLVSFPDERSMIVHKNEQSAGGGTEIIDKHSTLVMCGSWFLVGH